MSRAPTALRSIGGFGVAVACLSVAATAAVVVLVPEPAQPRMTGAEAIAALTGEANGLERRFGSPPEGPRALLLEEIIAAQMGRPSESVRAVWREQIASREFRIKAEDILHEDEQGTASSGPVMMIGGRDGTFRRLTPGQTSDEVRFSLANVPFPAFIASARQADGRWLTVAQPQPLLTGWQRNVLIALAISLLLLAPLAWVFARRLTRPFRTLAGAIEDTTGPIPQAGPRELREAAGAIAAMRTKLAGEAAERARILTAIAHDLRTPLTSLRLRIETVAEPQRSRMVADIERMQSMIGEVLGFARDAAIPVERVEMCPFVKQIVTDLGGAGAGLSILPGDDVMVNMPPLALRRVIENLLRNAVEYGDGGTLHIRQKQDAMVLTVSDAGPGIAEQDRVRLLAPFERGEESRNRQTGGVGLGLSIVREFAMRQGGRFALHESPEGGVRAVLRLPIA
ncbi:sensor histidine kinase [Erythrobacter sp. SAORIC-644]|uniref:sensor histidine kinase n=1 Tax=Erythrobacter sp. SAORIC-644 TaxID=1869314 RepID=UPI000C9F9FAC|nr:HAMP domain-containing sensor histidine kinase [Erythrobacter sp. SAORIC-644]PNQ76011.1 sensor histidine kinase [Erythrobacter sp. SAORIC-644]